MEEQSALNREDDGSIPCGGLYEYLVVIPLANSTGKRIVMKSARCPRIINLWNKIPNPHWAKLWLQASLGRPTIGRLGVIPCSTGDGYDVLFVFFARLAHPGQSFHQDIKHVPQYVFHLTSYLAWRNIYMNSMAAIGDAGSVEKSLAICFLLWLLKTIFQYVVRNKFYFCNQILDGLICPQRTLFLKSAKTGCFAYNSQ